MTKARRRTIWIKRKYYKVFVHESKNDAKNSINEIGSFYFYTLKDIFGGLILRHGEIAKMIFSARKVRR